MLTRYTARWVVTMVGPPIRDGWIEVEGDRIVAVGSPDEGPAFGRQPGAEVVNLGRVAVLPGLVNAHTHLELAEHRGAVPPAASLPEWVRQLLSVRGGAVDVDAVRAAIAEARAGGTSLVGDISNTLATLGPLRDSPLRAVVFHEAIGFGPVDLAQATRKAEDMAPAGGDESRVRVRIAAHAPYSVSPALFRALAAEIDRRALTPFSVHLGESPDEIEFLTSGGGAWRRLLDDLGAWDPAWEATGASPVQYLAGLGWIRDSLLVAHGVQLSDADLAQLAGSGATLVTCPRSNEWTGVGSPPLSRFYASGVPVAVGTDSLSSCPDLNLFAELAAMRHLAPAVSARRLLESATRVGADALGFGGDLGSISPGRLFDLVAVSLPEEVSDVEEYLVRGVDPSLISWVPVC